MNTDTMLQQIICRATGAAQARRGYVIQSLWSGYGEIVRYHLQGRDSIIVKHVRIPDAVDHPRGWHNDHAHARKLRSYEVEMHWYAHDAARCDETCRVPHCLAVETLGDERLILLEDLDTAGFAQRSTQADMTQIKACLDWLAHFHARFMHEDPDGLWPVGTYWHLATRPGELAAMTDDALRDAAPVIDSMLSSCCFRTFVHGDAKLANFCFSADGRHVAAVDFQYVGGGCGMKDVIYFLGSCLHEEGLTRHETTLIDVYFAQLQWALEGYGWDGNWSALESEWRHMVPLAHADFYRFLQGWMPDHRKINVRLQHIVQQVLADLSV